MANVTRKRKVVKPDEFILLRSQRPIPACEILPQGNPGLALINQVAYRLEYHSELPAQGEPVIRGYRLTKPDGTCYDLPRDLSECECMGSLRWSSTGTICKHRRALAQFQDERNLL